MPEPFKKPVYMDYHATTPVDPRVFAAMEPYFQKDFCNSASQTHVCGQASKKAIETARAQVAALIGAEPSEITFTSGATESNNWCLKSLVEHFHGQKNHIVTSSIEHSCVLDTCKYLQKRGVRMDFLAVDGGGRIDLEKLRECVEAGTMAVSVMAVNNEIGTINDFAGIGRICREKGTIFHTDATQSVGYIDIDVNRDNIDFLSMSSHKIYGPKGVGALFTSKKLGFKLPPLIHGGGHEAGLRSGTVNVPGVVGFGAACEIVKQEREAEAKKVENLRDRLWAGLQRGISSIRLNGHPQLRAVNNLNVSFQGVEAIDLIAALRHDVMVSSGSACASSKATPSHVLMSIGVPEQDCYSNIRFSVGRFTTEEEVDFVIRRVTEEVQKMRAGKNKTAQAGSQLQMN